MKGFLNWNFHRFRALDDAANRLQEISNNSEDVSASYLEGCLDNSVQHLCDVHLKVACRALDLLSVLVERFPYAIAPTLGLTMTSVFAVLSDRRVKLREQANIVLNQLRTAYEPVVLANALFPRLLDADYKCKTAFVQFLAVITPFCEKYFTQNNNLKAILGRLATLISTEGPTAPSASTVVAGKRLLELIYKVTPQVTFLYIGRKVYWISSNIYYFHRWCWHRRMNFLCHNNTL